MTAPQTLAFIEGQARYMVEHGFDVTCISSAGPYQESFVAREPVRLITVDMPRRITPLRDILALAALVRAIRSVRPDVVHAHTPKGGLLGMLAATIAGVPVRIYHMRGLPLMTASGLRRRLLTWSEQVSCALADRVLCVSHSLRRYAIDARLCPPEKILTLLGGSGNGVDAEGRFDPDQPEGDVVQRRGALRARFGIDDNAIVIAFVGRLVRDKGVVELVDAWRRLSARHPHLHLLVAGPFESQDPVPPDTRAALESDGRVHLMGQTSETRSVYAAADIITLPTYREGMPNVPLEAAAMRKPVVSTCIPGCVDAVLDGTTGTLVMPGDARALEAAIERYVQDKDLRKRHGAAGRQRILEEFDRRAIWAATRSQYEELLVSRKMRKRPADHFVDPLERASRP